MTQRISCEHIWVHREKDSLMIRKNNEDLKTRDILKNDDSIKYQVELNNEDNFENNGEDLKNENDL